MALRLDPTTLTDAKLRAGVGKALTEMITGLTDQPQGPHIAIHEARKTLKRLRALYRLVADGDKHFCERESARLRDAARHLAGGREAAAFAETARWLVSQARSADETALVSRIAAALKVRRDALSGADVMQQIDLAVSDCRGAMEGAGELSLPDSRKKMARRVARGWQHALRRGRRALSPLTVDAEADAFHELRKAIQRLNAYHDLLRPLWPQAMIARQDKLRDLIDTLGRENDLAGIAALMGREPQHFGEAIEQVVFQHILAKRRQALRLAALQQAAKIYATDPQEDARRIEVLWRAV